MNEDLKFGFIPSFTLFSYCTVSLYIYNALLGDPIVMYGLQSHYV